MDKVDSIRVQEAVQIINEKIRLEKQLIDVQKSLQNRKKHPWLLLRLLALLMMRSQEK